MIFTHEDKKLQLQVKSDELNQIDQGLEYSDERVKVSIVHAREDIVLVYSRLCSINNHLSALVRRITILLIMFGIFLTAFVLKQ
jgi:hypothetical protein